MHDPFGGNEIYFLGEVVVSPILCRSLYLHFPYCGDVVFLCGPFPSFALTVVYPSLSSALTAVSLGSSEAYGPRFSSVSLVR
jgi:hypothetical protein